jgi:hypothetical protein
MHGKDGWLTALFQGLNLRQIFDVYFWEERLKAHCAWGGHFVTRIPVSAG